MSSLPHVGDGGLPPHLEEQRTRMSVRSDAPSHTNTVEHAAAYQACGLDNSFSMERFRRDFRIEVQSLSEEQIVFDMIGIDAAIANAFRRILLSEVPTMAIEKVFILNNTSMIQDEVLAHRLGLIPIRADPRRFHSRAADEDADEHNVISFRLQVKCERRKGSGADGGAGPNGAVGGGAAAAAAGAGGAGSEGGRPVDCVNPRVTSADLEWIPQGDQSERFRDDPIRPVHDDILIAKLRPGQEIELEAWCEKGQGRVHAKWSPVCTASYRLKPEVAIRTPLVGAEAEELHAMCPAGVFDLVDVEDLAGAARAAGGAAARARGVRVARPRNCTMCRECVRRPGWDEKVQLSRVKDHFIFSIESTGSLPAEVRRPPLTLSPCRERARDESAESNRRASLERRCSSRSRSSF